MRLVKPAVEASERKTINERRAVERKFHGFFFARILHSLSELVVVE